MTANVADFPASEASIEKGIPYLTLARMRATRGEIPSLDGVRAASISIVMCSHFISSKLFPGGFGVLIFFVVSGFLITRLLLAEYKQKKKISLPNFYVRRFLRLYPVIIAFLIVVSIAIYLKGLPYSYPELASVLFYYTNYYFAMTPLTGESSVLPVLIFWSLAIEEHFYLVFPPLFVLLGCNPQRLFWLIAGTIVLALALRLYVAHLHPEYLYTHYFYRRTEMRMDSIATGVMLAVLCELPLGRRVLLWLARPGPVAVSIIAIFIGLLYRDPWFRETIRYSILNLSVAVLIGAVLFSTRYWPVNLMLNWRPVVWIGRLSYSLYVWHLGVSFMIGAADYSYWSGMVVQFVLSFIIAVISYYAIEQPFLAFRHRFGSERRVSVAAAD
jgi:peptidoglycan/LPS O-acetylase OafA/YrhL